MHVTNLLRCNSETVAMMSTIYLLIITTFKTALAVAKDLPSDVFFVSVDGVHETQNERNLLHDGDYCGGWVLITTDRSDQCMTANVDSYVKRTPCKWYLEDPPASQLWRWGENGNGKCTGLLRAEDGSTNVSRGCLRVDKNAYLTFAKCNKKDISQMWRGGGGQTSTKCSQDFCLSCIRAEDRRPPRSGAATALKERRRAGPLDGSLARQEALWWCWWLHPHPHPVCATYTRPLTLRRGSDWGTRGHRRACVDCRLAGGDRDAKEAQPSSSCGAVRRSALRVRRNFTSSAKRYLRVR